MKIILTYNRNFDITWTYSPFFHYTFGSRADSMFDAFRSSWEDRNVSFDVAVVDVMSTSRV